MLLTLLVVQSVETAVEIRESKKVAVENLENTPLSKRKEEALSDSTVFSSSKYFNNLIISDFKLF